MAGRIPQAFIDDLLERTDLVEVVDRRVPLRKAGRNYTARCPFHDEKTPSFSVNPDKQFFYCFGCGAGGNAISFVMDFDRVDFPQAVETLAHLAGLEVPREERAHEAPARQRQRDIYELLQAAADFYREQLRSHPQRQRAIDYLKQRGVSGEIVRDFGIGFAPPGWDNLLRALGQDEKSRQLLLEGGMLVQRETGDGGGSERLYDRFRDRLMFPILDNRGRVIAFGGRVLSDQDKPKYLNSPETPVFHKGRELYGLYQARRAQRQPRRLVVVEGYMDVVALAQQGIPYAVATLGTATSSEHLQKIFRHCSDVVFCFDGDRAGRQAAQRALDAALPVLEDGRAAHFLFLPEGDDPDSLVRKVGQTEFERLLDLAQPLETYLFDSAAEGLDLQSLEGRARFSRQAAPLIARLPEGVFKQLMLDALAERTGISRSALEALLQPREAGPEPAIDAPPVRGPRNRPVQRTPLPVRAAVQRDPLLYAIGLLLLHPRLGSRGRPEQFQHLQGEAAQLLCELLQQLHRRPESSTSMLLGSFHGQPWSDYISRALRQTVVVPDEGAEQELSDTLRHLQRGRRQQQVADRVEQLRNRPYA
ncbi:MAG: DNA primase, partial [Spongiibacteraceae bacterium]|nr:DNA primase [Spongiibacteraceae bacterium]